MQLRKGFKEAYIRGGIPGELYPGGLYPGGLNPGELYPGGLIYGIKKCVLKCANRNLLYH